MPEDTPTVDAPIAAVTVYRRGAVVRRTASLTGGTQTLRVTGLPLCLDDTSVGARVMGPGAPVVTGVRVALEVTDVDLPDPPEQQAVDAARLAEAHAAASLEALVQRAKALTALQTPDQPEGEQGAAPPMVPLSARMALLDFQHQRLTGVHDALMGARDDLRAAREEREKVEQDLKRATTDRVPRAHELRKAAHLTLLGGTEGEGPWTVELEYRVPGARWAPSYALRFDAQLTEVKVELRAAVAQRTGEDWRGAELTVSTAQPLAWTELPELPALRIGKHQPRPARTGWRAAPVGADALYADYRTAKAGTKPPRPRPKASPPQPQKPVLNDLVGAQAPPFDAEEEHTLSASRMDEPKRSRKRKSRGKPDAAPPLQPGQAKSSFMSLGAPARSAPAPIPAPPSAGAMPQVLGGPPGGGGMGEPPPPPELAAPADLLDYGRLRLSAPDTPKPGVLQPASRLQLYQESVTIERITIDRRVLTQVDQATTRADLSSLALPPGHVAPAPIRDFDHAWAARHPVDLQSDGAWHTLKLRESTGPASRRYVVVPREANEVFRTASFDNPIGAPLPTGPADVFVGGELLLTAPLRATDQGATVQLGLGVEEGIKVARNTRFNERSSGLLSTTLALEHEVDVEVSNNLALDAEIEVRERLPVHRKDDDDIEITDVHTEPAWQAWKQEQRPVRGSHRWIVDVPAKERRTLQLRYTVEIPGKKELVGGNRREA